MAIRGDYVWEHVPRPVIMEVGKVDSSGDDMIVISEEGFDPAKAANDEVLNIDNERLSIYGAMRAEEFKGDDVDGIGETRVIRIVVDVPKNPDDPDKSYKFDQYNIRVNGDRTSSPPQYILLESQSFPGHFVQWDLSSTAVICKELNKDLNGLEIQSKDGNTSPDVKFMWVVPKTRSAKFALQTYGRDYFLAFSQSDHTACLLKGDVQNLPENSIFRLQSQSTQL